MVIDQMASGQQQHQSNHVSVRKDTVSDSDFIVSACPSPKSWKNKYKVWGHACFCLVV